MGYTTKNETEFKEDIFEVESILEERYNHVKKRREWKVKWLNFSEDDCTWEPLESLEHNQQFHVYSDNKVIHNLKVSKKRHRKKSFRKLVQSDDDERHRNHSDDDKSHRKILPVYHKLIQSDDDEAQNQNSKYHGVTWNKNCNKWRALFTNNTNTYVGGFFDDQKSAAMSINLLCDKYRTERQNPTINLESDKIQQIQNEILKYSGFSWKEDNKQCQVHVKHNQQKYDDGELFNNKEHTAINVNPFYAKYEIEHQNPTIGIEPDAIQTKATSEESEIHTLTIRKKSSSKESSEEKITNHEEDIHGEFTVSDINL